MNRVLNMSSSASSSSNKRKSIFVDLSTEEVPVETLEKVSHSNAKMETNEDSSVETLVETLENVNNEETFEDVPVETTTFENVPDPIHYYYSASLKVNHAVSKLQEEYINAGDTRKYYLRDALEEVNNIVQAQYQMRRALRQIERFAVPNEDLDLCLKAVEQMKLIARRELRDTLPGDEGRTLAILPFIDKRIERREDERRRREGEGN